MFINIVTNIIGLFFASLFFQKKYLKERIGLNVNINLDLFIYLVIYTYILVYKEMI